MAGNGNVFLMSRLLLDEKWLGNGVNFWVVSQDDRGFLCEIMLFFFVSRYD